MTPIVMFPFSPLKNRMNLFEAMGSTFGYNLHIYNEEIKLIVNFVLKCSLFIKALVHKLNPNSYNEQNWNV